MIKLLTYIVSAIITLLLSVSLFSCEKDIHNPSGINKPAEVFIETDNKGFFSDLENNIVDFEAFTIRRNFCSAEDYIYEVKKDGDGIIISYYIDNFMTYDSDFDKSDSKKLIHEVKGDSALLRKVQTLAYESSMTKWDCFAGYDSLVLDGESFSFEATLSDGTAISAHGSNSFPSGFWTLCYGIENLLDNNIITSTEFICPYFSMTVPESWVNVVNAEYEFNYILFIIRPNEDNYGYLFRVDLSGYGYAYDIDSEKDFRIGRLVSGDDVLYMSFHDYGYFGLDDSIASPEQINVYNDLPKDLPDIIGSIKGYGDYEFIPEDGTLLYENDF